MSCSNQKKKSFPKLGATAQHHKNPLISDLLVRYTEKFINGYGKYFQEQLAELDAKLKHIDKLVAIEIYEQKILNSNIEMPVKEDEEFEKRKIKLTAPIEQDKMKCLQPMQSQHSFKMLSNQGVKSWNISARHLIQQKHVNQVCAKSKIDGHRTTLADRPPQIHIDMIPEESKPTKQIVSEVTTPR